jgi:ectoine hydroxylase-related dioxygenase (phytanoyl-CoA dioxygenase family)
MRRQAVSTAEQVSVDVRAVTDDEVREYKENGWTILRSLISPEAAADLLAVVKEKMGEHGDERMNTPSSARNLGAFAKWYDLDRESELFHALRYNRQLGRNAAMLMRRDMPIRSLTALTAVKLPKSAGVDYGKGETEWHQDHMATPARCTSLGFWLALDEITPDMGPMQFRNGSQREGLLSTPVLDWKLLEEYPLSEPLHLMPGDATAHSSLVVHGAGLNDSDRPRWGYIINTFPGDAPYVPYPTIHTAGIEDQLTPGKPLDHPRFPVIYSPAD